MTIITKYLGKTIITYILLVVVLLLGLQAFINFTSEFRDVGTGYYGIMQVLAYVPLMLPADVYQFFPMAGLLGCVIALGLLASHSELIVMRAAGMSLANITSAVIKAAFILVVFMAIIGEVVAPIGQRSAIANKTAALSGGQAILTRQGAWVRSGENFVHIDAVLSGGKLQGITRYQFDANQKLLLASYATNAVYQNKQWTFYDVAQTEFHGDGATTSHIPEQQWGLTFSPRLIGLSHVDTDQKSLPELRAYIKYRKQSGLDTANYSFAFWQRVFQPLATLVMIFLAIPFVFGPLRSATMGLRMLAGVMAGFAFYILNQFVGPICVVYHFPPILAAILPTLIFAGLGSGMVFRLIL